LKESKRFGDSTTAQPEDAGCGETWNLIGRVDGTIDEPMKL